MPETKTMVFCFPLPRLLIVANKLITGKIKKKIKVDVKSWLIEEKVYFKLIWYTFRL